MDPSIILSVFVLLVALGLHFYGSRGTVHQKDWFALELKTTQRLDRYHAEVAELLELGQNRDATVASLGRELEGFRAVLRELPSPSAGGVSQAEFAELGAAFKEITIAVAEGIERVDRSERRIKATVRRARKELADRGLVDDGLEAENYELSLLDGGGGEEGELPAMHPEVDEVADAPSNIAGLPASVLLRLRGLA